MSMKKAFTLVELMIAVSMLAIGIVLVLRSFLSASTALGIAQGKVEAMALLQVKMSELQEQAKLNLGVEPADQGSVVTFLGHDASFSKKITEITETSEDEKTELGGFSEVELKLAWKQSSRDRDAILSTYMPTSKKQP